MRTGLLLLNMGGPETLRDVRPFLFRLFRDPDILPLPRWIRWLAWPLAFLISLFRAPKSREAYAAIGGGTPLIRNDKAVARALRERLADAGVEVATVAMRYWHPLTDAGLDVLEFAGVERILAVPMYPQYSSTTTMSSFRELARHLDRRRRRWQPQVDILLDYHDDPRYVACVARRLEATLAEVPAGARKPVVLFSAHSIPTDRVREDNDPYPEQIEAFCATLAAGLPEGMPTALAYQSKVGPVEWVGPPVEEKLHELAAAGHDAVVVVPVSFTSEHVETLEELDLEYRDVAHESGIAHYRRVPTVGTDEDFLEFMTARIREMMEKPKPGPCRRKQTLEDCVCRQACRSAA